MIVYHGVADDAVTLQIDNYLDGIIQKSDFLEELKFKRPTHQICFCTNRSLQYIKRKDAIPDGFYYNLDSTIVSQLILDQNLSEMEATDLFFSSKTYRKYIAENTEIEKKTWQEIYEMLKNELKR